MRVTAHELASNPCTIILSFDPARVVHSGVLCKVIDEFERVGLS